MTEGEMMHVITRLKFELATAERRADIYRAGLVAVAKAETLIYAKYRALEALKEAEE